MKLHHLFAFLFIVSMSFFGPSISDAEEQIRVVLDNELQSYDQSTVLIDGTPLVPMRGIFESLGAVVTWDGVNQKITATKRNTTVELQIGVQTAKVTD